MTDEPQWSSLVAFVKKSLRRPRQAGTFQHASRVALAVRGRPRSREDMDDIANAIEKIYENRNQLT